MRHFRWDALSRYRTELLGAAIILILIFHFTEDVVNAPVDMPGWIAIPCRYYWRLIGSSGVDIFAFLSGLGLAFSLSRPNTNVGAFYKKRLIHLLPCYLIVGGLFWILKDVILLHRGAGRLLRDFFFISFFAEGVNTVWYVPYALGTYLIAPLLVPLARADNRRPWRATALVGGYVLLYLAAAARFPDQIGRFEIALSRIPVFFIGFMAAGPIRQKSCPPRWRQLAGVLLLGAALLILGRVWPADLVRSILQRWFRSVVGLCLMVGCCLLLFLSADDRSPVWTGLRRVLVWCGQRSLEIYLLHVTLRHLCNQMGLHTYRLSYYLPLLAVSLLLAVPLKKADAYLARKLSV